MKYELGLRAVKGTTACGRWSWIEPGKLKKLLDLRTLSMNKQDVIETVHKRALTLRKFGEKIRQSTRGILRVVNPTTSRGYWFVVGAL